MKLIRALVLAALLSLSAFDARAQVAFGNTITTDFTGDDTGSTFAATPAKPTATVDGTLQVIVGAIFSQSAGDFVVENLTGETQASEGNSATQFTAGIMSRAGLTADAATVDVNHSSAANATKSAVVMVFTGHDTGSPIRATGTPAGGNGTSAVCPDTASATSGDLILRTLIWFDDGDALAVTAPGSHTEIASDFNPAGSNGLAIHSSFATSAGGTPGTATYTLPEARDYVCFTTVIATAAGSSSGLLLRRRRS
jgi:hypothetical protein